MNMANPTAPREDVLIAHISDLHFGVAHQDETWKSLKRYLKDEHFDLVLATGDIVDSPSQAAYKQAWNELDGLDIPFFVCPGNHDRHQVGNSIASVGWLEAARARWAGPTRVSAWFDAQFRDQIPASKAPFTERELIQGRNRWRVRILGIDTSARADAAARGFVDLATREALQHAMKDADAVDLGILLAHHHPLPVRSLEEARQNRTKDLFNLTTLVNAGSLLETVTSAHIDLLLHGHEHAANWARYGSLQGGGGQSVVVGAGSATGHETLRGCLAQDMSFNVFRLTPRREVILQVLTRDGTKWQSRSIGLLDADELRRSRFQRQFGKDLDRPASSQVMMYLEVTRERDALVHGTRSDWKINNNKWALEVKNATGVPVDLRVTFTNRHGSRWSPPGDLKFERAPNDDFSWRFACEVPDDVAAEPQRIEFWYRWLGGGILTQEEMSSLDLSRAGPFRRQGLEYMGLLPRGSFAALTLAIRLPPEFAPDPNSVRVLVQDVAQSGSQPEERPEISHRLQRLTDSSFAVTIPYPWKGFRYAIVWKPPPGHASPEAARFQAVARQRGIELLGTFRQALSASPLHNATFALYLPSGQHTLGMVAFLDADGTPSTDRPAPEVTLRDTSTMLAQAWYGAVSISRQGNSTADLELGYLPGETALLAVPVRFGLSWISGAPWAVLRIGIKSQTDSTTALLHPNQGERIRNMLSQAVLAMLSTAPGEV
ncbi:MAG: metallophosphoesterase [Deltaproteobacteria bacterium]|nr:metallophosphoesterase [Deltaproteobacteria bacterium]